MNFTQVPRQSKSPLQERASAASERQGFRPMGSDLRKGDWPNSASGRGRMPTCSESESKAPVSILFHFCAL